MCFEWLCLPADSFWLVKTSPTDVSETSAGFSTGLPDAAHGFNGTVIEVLPVHLFSYVDTYACIKYLILSFWIFS